MGGGYAIIGDGFVLWLHSDEIISDGLVDYKIHCFNGEPKFILVCANRFESTGMIEDFYSTDWKRLTIRRPNTSISKKEMPRPELLDRMLDLSKVLSKDIPFLRTDYYIINNHIYFGELTFYPAGGFRAFEPGEWDYTFGNWIKL